MATRERYSYVRIARALEPTEHISDFFRKVRKYSESDLPARKTVGITVAQSLEEVKQQGVNPQITELKVPGIKFHDETDLDVLYYERRVHRS